MVRQRLPLTPALERLPSLGFGISTSLGIVEPDARSLVRRAPELVDFIEFAAGYRAHATARALFADELARGVRFIVHPTELSLDPAEPPSPAMLAGLRRLVEALGSPWTPQDIGTWLVRGEHLGGGFLPTPLTAAALDSAVARVGELQGATGVPFLVENPPFAEVFGDMSLGAFFCALCERTGAGMLLDVGHLVSYRLARPGDDGLFDELPWERVVEVHLAGGAWVDTPDGAVFWDDHGGEVAPEARALLGEVWPRLPNVRALCFECEGRPDDLVLEELEALRSLFALPGGAPR